MVWRNCHARSWAANPDFSVGFRLRENRTICPAFALPDDNLIAFPAPLGS
jgi:hypothetical protein